MCLLENKEKKIQEIISEIEENHHSKSSLREKYIHLKRILERNCKEITTKESLQFPSLFSRIVYISQSFSLPKGLEWQLQNIRVKASFLLKNEQNTISEKQYIVSYKSLTQFILAIYSDDILNYKYDESTQIEDDKPISNLAYLRIQVVEIDWNNELITGVSDSLFNSTIRVKYNAKNINDIFNSTINRLWVGAQLNLLECKLDNNGNYIPNFIVLEPDYLIDASAIAECFQNYGQSHLHYFRRKFEHTANSQHILLGNLANFFLDEFIFSDNPESLEFNDVFLKGFKQRPFEFTSCNDINQAADFRTFMTKARTQFANIKRVVTHDFPQNNIYTERCTLEPSFFSEKFGLQGRLDLLQLPYYKNDNCNIIELKSGGLPYPKEDKGKIAINHEVQTAIYRLIIQSVYGYDEKKITSAILYSAAEKSGENLRLAVVYRTLEKEIINLRNLIVTTEHDLYSGNYETVEKLFTDICNIDNYGRTPSFFIDQIADFYKTISSISDVERKYLFRYIIFLSRELYIQKIGDDHFESNKSTASLWNTEFNARIDSFDLISDLKIKEIDDTGRDMKILFERSSPSDFINFREGEICILYPHEEITDSVLTNQILKGTIAEITPTHILLRFRYKQKNKTYFEKYTSWAIEHDKLDHAYNNMYKSLYTFISSPIDKREILLGLKAPLSTNVNLQISDKETNIQEKQNRIIEKAILANDYFLIVGPPGTGKTSIFARRLIEHYYNNTEDNILIIAYTNRAVDELCESINQAFRCNNKECDSYIRIGTELSCDEHYRHRLLQNIADKVKSRDELREIINKHRIFIGTLASISGKLELFDIKKFNLSIIDEASQILEPQIIGILPKVDKFIMIGDHKQLSTITLQNQDKSQSNNEELNIIKLFDCGESLFERLYRICQANKWEHAYETLVYQGRMHQILAGFPNEKFYNNILLPANIWQSQPLSLKISNNESVYTQIVNRKRIAFINCIDYDSTSSDKINYKESEIVVELSKAILEAYQSNNLNFDPHKTLGIITPYRNQIALIKHQLYETGIPELQNIMIDTVERYQGSQREIIVLSFCINKPYQLSFFCNLNSDKTVDRKLNVAITRAKQQLFLIGNEYVLAQNPIYKNLLEYIKSL